MPLTKKIEKLQKKPKEERVRILIISVTAIMLLIIGLWLTTNKYLANKAKLKSVPGPASLLWQNIKSANFIFEVKNIF